MTIVRAAGLVVALLLAAGTLSPRNAAAQFPLPPDVSKPPKTPDWNGTVYATSWDLYQAMKAKVQKAPSARPNWTGTWTKSLTGAVLAFGDWQPRNPKLKVGWYGLPTGSKLTPEYQALYDKKVTDVDKGVEWDNLSACLPAGYPRWLMEPFLREFIVRPEETWMITEQQSEVRRIYTDGRGHVPDDEAYPLWEGDSIGFWDGDTLVVHTNNLRAGQYQRGQPDYSDQVSTVERWRKTGPKSLYDEVWVYDPKSLQVAWHVGLTYEKLEPLRINMWSCNENNNVFKTKSGSSDFILPGEKGYVDPDKIGKPTG